MSDDWSSTIAREMIRLSLNICFAASSGGHYEQLILLKPLIEKYKSFILTEATNYTITTIKDRRCYFLKQVNRKEVFFPMKMILNTFKSFAIFCKENPDIIITTGVLATIPICIIAKVFRRKIIYIESFAKIDTPTMTGRLLYKFADQFYVQWEELLKYYPNAIYKGGIY